MTTVKNKKDYTSWDKLVVGRVDTLRMNYLPEVGVLVYKKDDLYGLKVDGDVLTFSGENLLIYVNGMIQMGKIMTERGEENEKTVA